MSTADLALALGLEAAFAEAWPTLDARRSGDWTIKIAGRVSRRSNSANPDDARSRLTPAVVADIEAAYAAAGQPAYVRIPSFLDPQAEAMLAERGYGPEGFSLSLIAPLPLPPAASGAELTARPSADWIAAANRIAGRSPEAASAFAAILARLTIPAAFAAVRRDDRIVALAYGAVYKGWLCVEAVATDPAWRGQGLATQAVTALMLWGGAQGAVRAGLQVQADNAAGQAVYRRLGFNRELYRYHYRRAP